MVPTKIDRYIDRERMRGGKGERVSEREREREREKVSERYSVLYRNHKVDFP
jgi:hypothetical protein